VDQRSRTDRELGCHDYRSEFGAERRHHAPIKLKAFRTQLKAIKKWGRGTPDDLSKITQPTLVANGDNDRMVLDSLRGSAPAHRGLRADHLPDSGHGGIFQFHDELAPVAVEFIGR
jgi:pimeloyl-ACP methyl ester carboxylesterase